MRWPHGGRAGPRAQARSPRRREPPGSEAPARGRRPGRRLLLPDPRGPVSGEADTSPLPFHRGRRGPERGASRPRTQSRPPGDVSQRPGPASAPLPPPRCPRDGGHAGSQRRPPPRRPRSVQSPRPLELVHKSSLSTSSAQACLSVGGSGLEPWAFRGRDCSSSARLLRRPGAQGQCRATLPSVPASEAAQPLGAPGQWGRRGTRAASVQDAVRPDGAAVGTAGGTWRSGHHTPYRRLSPERWPRFPTAPGSLREADAQSLKDMAAEAGRPAPAEPAPDPRDRQPRTIMAAGVLWEPLPDWAVRRRPASYWGLNTHARGRGQ